MYPIMCSCCDTFYVSFFNVVREQIFVSGSRVFRIDSGVFQTVKKAVQFSYFFALPCENFSFNTIVKITGCIF